MFEQPAAEYSRAPPRELPLTLTQSAVMRLLRTVAPAPLSGAAIAAELGMPEGVLRLTLRSLQRAGMIVVSQGPCCGWALPERRTAERAARELLEHVGREQLGRVR